MRTVFKITLYLLLALWLPATNHCDLQAVNFAGHAEEHHDSLTCVGGCQAGTDLCFTIESDSIPRTANELKVPPPASLDTCLLMLLVTPQSEILPPAPFFCDPPEIESLHRTWSFVRRAAPLARAPSLLG